MRNSISITIPLIYFGILLPCCIIICLVIMCSACQQEGGEQEQPVPGEIRDPNVEDDNRIVALPYDIESFEEFSRSRQMYNTTENLNKAEMLAQFNRNRLIHSKLHYQIVLPDRSNADIQSLRNGVSPKVDEETTNVNGHDGDDHSTIASDHVQKPIPSSSSLSLYHRVQDLFSIRNSLRPRKQDICSVCLEEFQPMQTICAAKNSCCHHLFHEDCIQSWLLEHDDCPLCRSNMMA